MTQTATSENHKACKDCGCATLGYKITTSGGTRRATVIGRISESRLCRGCADARIHLLDNRDSAAKDAVLAD